MLAENVAFTSLRMGFPVFTRLRSRHLIETAEGANEFEIPQGLIRLGFWGIYYTILVFQE